MKTLATAILGGVAALALASSPASAATASAPAAPPAAKPALSPTRALADRLAIEDLLARYEWALDAGDAQGYGALFAEDGVITSNFANPNGRAAIVKMIVDLKARMGTARPAGAPEGVANPILIQHILSNIVIDLHGDTADAKSTWTEIWNPKGPSLEVRAAGHYEDKLVRKGGKWWFARRHIADDIMPVAPKP